MAIIQLTKQHREDVVNLFGDELIYYQFMVNEMIHNNYVGDDFRVYGEYENNKLVSLLLNNFGNVTYYSKTDHDVSVYQEIFPQLRFYKLSGPSELMGKFLPYIEVKSDTCSHLGVIKEIKVKRKYPELTIKKVQTEYELSLLYDLLATIDEYVAVIPRSKEEFIENEMKKIETSNSRTVYVQIGYEMVASAATVNEYDTSAIIVGVSTHKAYRNKGYGTEVLIGLFEELLNEGKYPYLFYNNPVARSVYLNLGIEEICEWRVIEVK